MDALAEPAPDAVLEPAAALAPGTALTPQPLPPAAPHSAAPRHWLWQRMAELARLMRIDRPIGIGLLLWPTLWALWMANGGRPPLGLLLIFVTGTVLMRSAGCVMNDLLDRNIDPHVRRTRHRPLAARHIAPLEALLLFAVLVTLAFVLVLQLGAPSVRLAFIGAALTLTYPLFKRFFPIPQLYLGLAFGWGVPMAFAATLGVVPRVGWVLLMAAIVWAGVYDTFYAMADRQDDQRIGVKSSAITFGDLDLLMIGAMQAMTLLSLLLVGRLLEFGRPYNLSLLAAAALFARQQWLARARDVAGCLRAFHDNNYVGLVVLAGVILEYALHA